MQRASGKFSHGATAPRWRLRSFSTVYKLVLAIPEAWRWKVNWRGTGARDSPDDLT